MILIAKILVVDDSILMTSILRNFIHRTDPAIDVIEAHTGEEALGLFEKERPALVFLDIRMPGIDGLEALERLMKLYPLAKIVMCTSVKEDALVARATSAGAVGYILKPFRQEQIEEMVKKNLA